MTKSKTGKRKRGQLFANETNIEGGGGDGKVVS